MDISIVIPCFNEAESIDVLSRELSPVVEHLRRTHSVELLFVDDGSADGTGDLLEARFGADPAVRVVRHDRNRGLGAALRTGMGQARGDVIVTTDSDNTYPYALIPPLLERLQPGIDIVTSSCYHPDGGVDNVPAYRVWLSKTASFMYRVLLDWRLHTYTSMFRAYRRRVVETVPFESDDYLALTELLANALCAGYVVAELPCTLRVRRYGQSKAKVVRITKSHLRFQWDLVRQQWSPLPSVARVSASPPIENLNRPAEF